jgi:hypothetical protein
MRETRATKLPVVITQAVLGPSDAGRRIGKDAFVSPVLHGAFPGSWTPVLPSGDPRLTGILCGFRPGVSLDHPAGRRVGGSKPRLSAGVLTCDNHLDSRRQPTSA